jgi:hypothetical protein
MYMNMGAARVIDNLGICSFSLFFVFFGCKALQLNDLVLLMNRSVAGIICIIILSFAGVKVDILASVDDVLVCFLLLRRPVLDFPVKYCCVISHRKLHGADYFFLWKYAESSSHAVSPLPS